MFADLGERGSKAGTHPCLRGVECRKKGYKDANVDDASDVDICTAGTITVGDSQTRLGRESYGDKECGN